MVSKDEGYRRKSALNPSSSGWTRRERERERERKRVESPFSGDSQDYKLLKSIQLAYFIHPTETNKLNPAKV